MVWGGAEGRRVARVAGVGGVRAHGGLDDVGVGVAPRLAGVGFAGRHRRNFQAVLLIAAAAEQATEPLKHARRGLRRGSRGIGGAGREVGVEVGEAGGHRRVVAQRNRVVHGRGKRVAGLLKQAADSPTRHARAIEIFVRAGARRA